MGQEVIKEGEQIATNKEAQSPLNAIERAEQAAARIEAANQKAEELLKSNEEILSRMILGGKSTINNDPPKQEMSNKEYAKAALRGKFNNHV